MCTEDIPRQERAAENYEKQSVLLDTKVKVAWTKWDESRKKMEVLFSQALSTCPELLDFVKCVQLQSEVRVVSARDNLRHKLLCIENEEINAFTEYMSDMPSMLKKLYLTLKGYDKAPPALTTEYLEIMRKAKSAKGITWSDRALEVDAHFKFVSTLDLQKPTATLDFSVKRDPNATVDLATDSDDLTDLENRDPVLTPAKKRKGTPIKLPNNETIIINDSLEMLDTTRNLNSAKKIKREYDVALDVENLQPAIDPKDLNSTFVLTGKMEILNKQLPIKTEIIKTDVNLPLKRGLVDRTNTMPRTMTFNDKGEDFYSLYDCRYFFKQVLNKFILVECKSKCISPFWKETGQF